MRSYLAYRLYILKNKFWEQIISLINIFLFIFSLYQTISGFNFQNTITIYRTVLTITGLILIWEIFSKLKGLRDGKKLTKSTIRTKQFTYNSIKLSRDYKMLSHRYKVNNFEVCNRILYSDLINDYLIVKNDMRIEMEFSVSKQMKIQSAIRKEFDKLRLFLKIKYMESRAYNKDFFNETKLCLSEDIELNKPVKCHKGSYFDSLLTNFVSDKYIEDEAGGIIADYTSHFVIKEKNKTIESITETILNNHIGVSTIGFTKDNYMVFWIQNSRAQGSNDLIVPTGSGSVDYQDLDKGKDFIRTLKNGMERELFEESTKIRFKELPSKTIVIGYFRWMEKSGKPEFVGITKLSLDYNELVNNLKEVRTVNLHENHLLKIKVNNSEDVLNHLEKQFRTNKQLSTPLYYNIYSLIQYIVKFPHDFQSNILGN